MSNRSQTAYRGPSALGRAIQLYLAGQLRSLQKIAPDLEHRDPAIAAEAVHDLRVTCQQMRSVLQVFSSFLPDKPAASLDKRIRQLQRAFRTVRDQYILLGQPELPPEMRQTLEKQQEEAMGSLLQAMSSRRFCRDVEKLCDKLLAEKMEIQLSPEPLTKKGVVQLHRLDAVVPAVLYRQAAAITAYRAFIPDQLIEPVPDPVLPASQKDAKPLARFWENPDWPAATMLHRLRLSWKHLRHVLMMLCPLWGDLGDNLIAICKETQDQLGLLHDRQLLAEALLSHAEKGDSSGTVAQAWPGIMSSHTDALRSFLDRWRDMDMAWFHKQLLPLVEWSVQQASCADEPMDGKTEGSGEPLPVGTPVEGSGEMPPDGSLPEGPSIDDGPERDSRLAAIFSEAADDWPD